MPSCIHFDWKSQVEANAPSVELYSGFFCVCTYLFVVVVLVHWVISKGMDVRQVSVSEFLLINWNLQQKLANCGYYH